MSEKAHYLHLRYKIIRNYYTINFIFFSSDRQPWRCNIRRISPTRFSHKARGGWGSWWRNWWDCAWFWDEMWPVCTSYCCILLIVAKFILFYQEYTVIMKHLSQREWSENCYWNKRITCNSKSNRLSLSVLLLNIQIPGGLKVKVPKPWTIFILDS